MEDKHHCLLTYFRTCLLLRVYSIWMLLFLTKTSLDLHASSIVV